MYDAHTNEFANSGYTIVRGLFSPAEVAHMQAHYLQLNVEKRAKAEVNGVKDEHDPLKRFPRMLQMHRWDEVTLQFLLDSRLKVAMTAILGSEPYAVQSMIYFKPPTARGQALHQDQYYWRVEPGTCVAAWLALDDCDEENGCLQVVPGSHNLPVLCTIAADSTQSFTDVTVPVPEGMAVAPVLMQAGDVLFFNGQLIHGSLPNRSSDRFRRSLIGHYVVGEAEKVERDGTRSVEMIGLTKAVGVAQ